MLAALAAIGIVTFFVPLRDDRAVCQAQPAGLVACLVPSYRAGQFAALTASELFVHGGEVVLALPRRPWAALVAALVAWRTGNVLATIGAGMAALYLFRKSCSIGRVQIAASET